MSVRYVLLFVALCLPAHADNTSLGSLLRDINQTMTFENDPAACACVPDSHSNSRGRSWKDWLEDLLDDLKEELKKDRIKGKTCFACVYDPSSPRGKVQCLAECLKVHASACNYFPSTDKDKDHDDVPDSVNKWFKKERCDYTSYDERPHPGGRCRNVARNAQVFSRCGRVVRARFQLCDDQSICTDVVKELRHLDDKLKNEKCKPAVELRAKQCTAYKHNNRQSLPLDFVFGPEGCQVRVPDCDAVKECKMGRHGAPVYGWCSRNVQVGNATVKKSRCLKCESTGQGRKGTYREIAERGECAADLGIDLPEVLDKNACFGVTRSVETKKYRCEIKCSATNSTKIYSYSTTLPATSLSDAQLIFDKDPKSDCPNGCGHSSGRALGGYPKCEEVK